MIERDSLRTMQEDQRRRWGQGERVPVEFYLEQNPTLGVDPEAVLDLILGEVILREEAGERPRLDEFLGRFPHLEVPLRLQFEVHQALEDAPLSALATLSAHARPWTAVSWTRDEAIDQAPNTLPGYEILDELGRGGMGVVYRARQVGLNRPVALKMILAGSHAGPNERARFRIEAEAVARLQHPNIVQVYEVGECDGRPFLSLELVEGGGLERKLAGVPQPPREAASLVEVLARAVHHVHRHGILHRDLKPSNVLLTTEGVPKITDFGLAKLLDSDSGQTPTEALIGTPGYMAPEQASGHARLISARSDVYALGAILYESLTGRPPFRAETPLDTIRLVLSQEPVSPTRLQPRMSRDLETICLKCLEKEPQQRYADAGTLADDLARFQAGEPIRARPVSIGRRGLKWARRRPTTAALATVILMAALILIGHTLRLRQAERRSLTEKRSTGERLVSQAQLELAGRDWTNAKAHLAGALAEIGREPALADVRSLAERRLAEVDRRLDEQSARQDALARRRRFEDGRNDVLFRGTQPVDGDAPANLQAARDAARLALDAVGLSTSSTQGARLRAAFTADEEVAVISDAYELLLVLANCLAQPWPRQTPEQRRARLDEALRTLDQAATLRPTSRAYHLRRAQILALLGDAAGAMAERSRENSLPVAGAVDAFLVGVDRFMGGAEPPDRSSLTRAIADFEQALRWQPGHFWALYYLAVAHLNSGRPDLATGYLTACLGQRPDWVWAYLLRGAATGRLGQFDFAEADFRKAEELHPNPEGLHAFFINRGIVRYEEGEFDASGLDFDRAIALRPGHYQAYANLALLRKKQGRFDDALGQLHEALGRKPPELILADLQTERALLLWLAGRPEAAFEACETILASRPTAAEVLGIQAHAALSLERNQDALRSFDRYLEVGGAATSDVHRGRGRARMRLGDYAGAADDYTRALVIKPDWEIQTHRGWAYFFAEAPRLALRDFEEGVRLNPANVDAYVGRGLAHVALGHLHDAIADAEEALRREPATAEMLHNIACVFAQAAGRWESDPGGPPQDDPTASYRRRAVEAIRQALARLPDAERPAFWREKILPDRYLDPIRRSPEFLEFEGRVGRELAPPTPRAEDPAPEYGRFPPAQFVEQVAWCQQ